MRDRWSSIANLFRNFNRHSHSSSGKNSTPTIKAPSSTPLQRRNYSVVSKSEPKPIASGKKKDDQAVKKKFILTHSYSEGLDDCDEGDAAKDTIRRSLYTDMPESTHSQNRSESHWDPSELIEKHDHLSTDLNSTKVMLLQLQQVVSF